MKEKINWRVYERDHIYPQSIAAYLDLIKINPSAKYPYIAKYYEVMSYIDDYFWWARDLDKLEMAFRRWMNMWLRHPVKYKQFLKEFSISHRQVHRILPKLKNRTKHFKNFSNAQLYDLYYQAKDVLLQDIYFSEYTVDLFDDFFNQIFAEKTNEASKRSINPVHLQKLLRPACSSESLLYHKKLLEFSLKKNLSHKSITALTNHFSWIMMNWVGSNEITINQVQREIAALKKKSVQQRKKELRAIKFFSQEIKEQRTKIVRQYRLPFKQLAPLIQK
jgi:hypothetical protein